MMMPSKAIIFSQDEALERKVTAFSSGIAEFTPAHTLHEIEAGIQGIEGLLIVADLRTPDYEHLLQLVSLNRPSNLVIGIAVPGSDPERAAIEANLYHVIAPDFDRRVFQMLLSNAMAHLALLQENAMIRAGRNQPQPDPAPTQAPSNGSASDSYSLRAFSSALRNFEQSDLLYQQIVEGVAGITRVSRAGLFYRAGDKDPFTLLAGTRCLERTLSLSFSDHHPLVLWLNTHAHIISRLTLEHVNPHEHRLMLKQAMDLFGAEVLIPIHIRERFAGWIILGHHITGRPFTHGELEDLMTLVEHVSVVLENARLYEEVSFRKVLAETLFDTLPTGIIAVNQKGTLLWVNRAAEKILGIDGRKHIDQPVDSLGSRFADRVYRTLDGDEMIEPEVWPLPPGRRFLSVQTRRLPGLKDSCGAVAVIQDITDDLQMKEKQDQLARCAFWAELTASISHELRNPLVSIKTFAQLLPEQYADPEFRSRFSQIMHEDIDRLDAVIKQMNQFANLPRLELEPADVSEIIQRGIDAAKLRVPSANCPVSITAPPGLGRILADSRALAECFSHLFANSMEAMNGQASPQIQVRVTPIAGTGENPGYLQIAIADNGHGIDDKILPNVFSPFCTTKNRGMGLGLPIVQRTILDHNGHVDIDSSARGTTVTLVIPLAKETAEQTA